MSCTACYLRAESKIGAAFASYGRFLARHPWKFIIGCVLVNGLLGIGMIRLKSETDTATVYTPMNSQAQQDSEKVRTLFSDMSGISFSQLQLADEGLEADVIVRAPSGNVMDNTVLEEVKQLYNYVVSIDVDYDGENISVSNICARDIRGCVVAGDFFFSPEFIVAVNNRNVTYPVFHHPKTGMIFYQNRVGDVRVNGTILTSAGMLSLRFYFRTDGDKYKQMYTIWKDKFISKMKSFFSKHIEIAFSHSDSLGDELSNTISGDITLFSITFTIMITYACVATLTAKWDCVGQRSLLGYPGVIAAGISIISSFGLVSACGVKFVSIVGVMPFLIIGIGVDDMFILLSGLSDAQEKETVEEKIAETMRKSGVAITITSLTDLLAFIAGATSIFLGVRNFCIYTGAAVLFCYLNQTTLFVACLTLHEKRVAARRHFIACIKVISKDEAIEAKRSKRNILCCTGSPPRSRKDVESFLDKLPGWLLPKIVLNLPMKIIILILFAVYLAASIYGITIHKQGLELKHLVSESSYYYKFRDWSDTHFQTITPISFVISSTITYSDVGNQNKIRVLLDNIKKDNEIQNTTEINWLSAYQRSIFYNNSSETGFVSNLKNRFLKSPLFKRFENDVAFDDSNTTISASRYYVFSVDQKSTMAQGNLMLRMRKAASQSSLPVFAFAPSFIYFEQYVEILPQTLQTVGIAIVAVFFVTVLFMPHPVLLIFLTITVAMIMVGIFGFLDYFGLTLSSITMVHIVMSVGFSVDFTAHICHGYMISTGDTRNERVRSTLVRSGSPIFHGATSSLLGVIILLKTSSYIFMSFFKIMLLVIIFGIAHAVLFLPVIFSFIGPHQKNSRGRKVTDVKDSEITFQQPLGDIEKPERFHEEHNCVNYQNSKMYNACQNKAFCDEIIKQGNGAGNMVLEQDTMEIRYKRNWEGIN
ncbi:hypothetical protein ACJMK2_039093 [Sinanodonta woodiana]|uniref:SSD domain-containing protein n=1 Tax=Sinanodonta woodiana TaxID=1069815 RepID=A0ABD3WEC3_SINWO